MSSYRIVISLPKQELALFDGDNLCAHYPVSTAAAGAGFMEGSGKTPTGRFRIAEKIGEGLPRGTVFRSRIPAGHWISQDNNLKEDLITSRILWLDGMDRENANTKERYIYIHGTNHENMLGRPCSCGCIRMANDDIVRLFDQIKVDTVVEIIDDE